MHNNIINMLCMYLHPENSRVSRQGTHTSSFIATDWSTVWETHATPPPTNRLGIQNITKLVAEKAAWAESYHRRNCTQPLHWRPGYSNEEGSAQIVIKL